MLYFKNIRIFFIGHRNTHALQACQMRDRIMEEANVEVRETTRDNRGERRGDCLHKFELDVLAHRAHTHR